VINLPDPPFNHGNIGGWARRKALDPAGGATLHRASGGAGFEQGQKIRCVRLATAGP